MLRISLLSLLTALTTFAAETAPTTGVRNGVANPFNSLNEVEGVSKEDLLKFRRAASKTATDPELKAARDKVQEIRQLAEFASDDEKKSLRNDIEAAVSKVVELTRAAIAKAEPSLSSDVIAKVTDALEKQQRSRFQGAQKKTATVNGKTFPGTTEEKAETRDPQADKKPTAKIPNNRGTVQVPQVAGVSTEDTAKFKAALGRAYQNADWKAARTKLQELAEKTQFLTGSEKADMRPEFEAATSAMRKAMRAAVAQTDPTLTPETIEKISEAMEQQMRGKAK